MKVHASQVSEQAVQVKVSELSGHDTNHRRWVQFRIAMNWLSEAGNQDSFVGEEATPTEITWTFDNKFGPAVARLVSKYADLPEDQFSIDSKQKKSKAR